jgi:quercetin dioxygenase-like cupin family protein
MKFRKTNDRRDFLNALMTAALVTGATSEAVHAQQAPGKAGPSGRGTQRQPLPAPFAGMEASITPLTIQPGAAPSKPHTHPGFVLGYVIEGDYLFAINNETPRVVHAGEIFFEPAGATHTTHASAIPDQTVKLLAIVISPKADAAKSMHDEEESPKFQGEIHV